MEQENIKELLNAWMQVAWGNKEIMMCLNVGLTKASQIHNDAKMHKGLFKSKAMKTKVKADVVCQMLGIDRNAEIKRLMNYLN